MKTFIFCISKQEFSLYIVFAMYLLKVFSRYNQKLIFVVLCEVPNVRDIFVKNKFEKMGFLIAM